MKYKVSPKKIMYLYNYVITGTSIQEASFKAGYSKSYSNRINSYDNWMRILQRIERIDAKEEYYEKVCNEVQLLQKYHENQSRKSKSFNQ